MSYVLNVLESWKDEWEQKVRTQRELEGLRAAVRDPVTKKVYTGWSHQAAINSVPKGQGDVWSRLHHEWDKGTEHSGFADHHGNFVSRSEAESRWNVSTREDVTDTLRRFRKGY